MLNICFFALLNLTEHISLSTKLTCIMSLFILKCCEKYWYVGSVMLFVVLGRRSGGI